MYEFHVSTSYPFPVAGKYVSPQWNIVITLVMFMNGLYHSLWAYAGESELQNLVVACVLPNSECSLGYSLSRYAHRQYPVTILCILFKPITFIFISRFSYRFLRKSET